MEADNSTDRSTRTGTRWDFAAVDAAPDPQSFVRYLQQRPGSAGEGESEALDLRRQLSYDLLEVHEGQHLLDVGCGLGDDVRALARLVGASGRMVGLDNSERLLEAARSRSEGAAYPGTFVQGDMHHMPFANASFDGCRAERVLIHSAQPRQVVEEMRRVVHPGGRIVVTEPDLDTLVFHAASQAVVRKLTQWHSDRVRHGTIGRWLPEVFRHCGLEDIRVVPTVALNSQLASYPQTLAMQALEAGVLTAEEAQDVVADWQRRAEQQNYLEFGVFFTVAGRTST
jgi:ubiquinone/menaquinone biosynthesis C-methylase UbiE